MRVWLPTSSCLMCGVFKWGGLSSIRFQERPEYISVSIKELSINQDFYYISEMA